VNDRQRFDHCVLPHLDAAYNLARWLLRNDGEAEDAVQEACLRAWRHLGSLRGDDAKPWLLGIVRHTCFSQLERRRGLREQGGFDEDALDELAVAASPSLDGDPAAALQNRRLCAQVDEALRALPPLLREVVVLRELEDLAYADMAAVIGVPIGTVMSRLSRARARLRDWLRPPGADE
jgi:RNA polymerase sigma-70 factor (ECF subfamily)